MLNNGGSHANSGSFEVTDEAWKMFPGIIKRQTAGYQFFNVCDTL